jgi:hypothetical protein
MPRRLLVIGGIYTAIGAASALGMAVWLFTGHGLRVDVTVFLLPVGLGLLRAKPSSRRWAAFWAGFVGGLLLLGLALVSLLGGSASAVFSVGPLTGFAANLFVLGIVALCVLAVWVLYTPPVSMAFSKRPVAGGGTDDPSDGPPQVTGASAS